MGTRRPFRILFHCPEILTYFDKVAEEHALRKDVCLSQKIIEAVW
jgi:hypothetical protein